MSGFVLVSSELISSTELSVFTLETLMNGWSSVSFLSAFSYPGAVKGKHCQSLWNSVFNGWSPCDVRNNIALKHNNFGWKVANIWITTYTKLIRVQIWQVLITLTYMIYKQLAAWRTSLFTQLIVHHTKSGGKKIPSYWLAQRKLFIWFVSLNTTHPNWFIYFSVAQITSTCFLTHINWLWAIFTSGYNLSGSERSLSTESGNAVTFKASTICSHLAKFHRTVMKTYKYYVAKDYHRLLHNII